MPTLISSEFFSGSKPIALVVGGDFFTAPFVCSLLLNKNSKVIFLTEKITNKSNFSAIIDHANFKIVEAPLTKKIITSFPKIDYVVHLGDKNTYTTIDGIGYKSLEENSLLLKNLLECSKKYSAKALFTSGLFTKLDGGVESNFSEVHKFAELLIQQYSKEFNINSRIVRVGNLYGPGMSLTGKGEMQKIIKDVVYNNPLAFEKNKQILPLYILDFSEGVIKALFSSGTQGKVINLFGKPISTSNLVSLVNRIKGESSIVNSLEEADLKLENAFKNNSDLWWLPKTNLDVGMRNTFNWFLINRNSQPVRVAVQEDKSKKRNFLTQNAFSADRYFSRVGTLFTLLKREVQENLRNDKGRAIAKKQKNPQKINRRQRAFVLTLLSLFLFLLFIFPFCSSFIGAGEFYLSQKELKKGESSKAIFWARQSSFWFSASKTGYEQWSLIPGLGQKSRQLSHEVDLYNTLVEVQLNAIKANEKATALTTQIVTGQGITPPLLNDLSLAVAKLKEELSFFEAESQFIKGKGTLNILENLRTVDWEDIRSTLQGLETLTPYLPQMTGVDKKQTYLVLIQDTNKLRPTGGVILAYGFLTFEKGRLTNAEIHDVNVADSQLKGHVDPPAQLRDYQNKGNWSLEDSNWSADFPTSAQKAAWFIEKELGVTVDGVIGTDTTFFEKVLQLAGPIKTDKGLVEAGTLSSFIQADPARLSLVVKKIVEEGKDTTPLKAAALNFALLESLSSRHLSLWLVNPQVNQVLSRIKWDGGLLSSQCVKNCASDYLQVVDANMGGLSLDAKKDYRLDLSLEEGTVKHRLVINFTNGTTGEYKNYLRVYAQKGSTFNSAMIMDERNNQTAVKVDQTQELDLEVYGMYVDVPQGEQKSLIISWDTAWDVTKSQNFAFLWQKQMGSPKEPANITINFPQGNKALVTSTPLLTQPGLVEYNTTLGHDFETQLIWQAK